MCFKIDICIQEPTVISILSCLCIELISVHAIGKKILTATIKRTVKEPKYLLSGQYTQNNVAGGSGLLLKLP